jgi:hypothetical protein
MAKSPPEPLPEHQVRPARAYGLTWSGSCSGTCTSMAVRGDRNCHLEFTPASLR